LTRIFDPYFTAKPKGKAHAMGIKGFLMKPVVKSALAKEVRRVLDEARRPDRNG